MMQNQMLQQQPMGGMGGGRSQEEQRFYGATSKLVPSVKAENPHMK